MRRTLVYLICVLGLNFFPQIHGQAFCGIEPPNPPFGQIYHEADEDAEVNAELVRFPSYGQLSTDPLDAPIHPYLRFEFLDSSLVVTLLKSLSDSFDEDNTDTIGDIEIITNCLDGSATPHVFTLRIIDVNNRPPVFEETEYALSISTPWPEQAPINSQVSIIVTDDDFTEINADTVFTTDDDRMTVSSILTESCTKPKFIHTLQVILNDPVPEEEEIRFVIIATSGDFDERAEVVVTVTKTNVEPPQFGQRVYKSIPIMTAPELGEVIVLDVPISASDAEQSEFEFFVEGPHARFVTIDVDGQLTFNAIDFDDIEELQNGVAVIEVIARETQDPGYESASIVLIFFDIPTVTTACTCTPCPEATTEWTPCPDTSPPSPVTPCPVIEPCMPCTTEFPGIICPVTSSPSPVTPCPDIEPCMPCTTEFPGIICPVTSSPSPVTPCPDIEPCTTLSPCTPCPGMTPPTPCPVIEPCMPCTTESPEVTQAPCEFTPPMPCPSLPEMCEDCPTECPDDEDECASDTGFIAGILVTSILFLGAVILAVYFWYQLRKLSPDMERLIRVDDSALKPPSKIERWGETQIEIGSGEAGRVNRGFDVVNPSATTSSYPIVVTDSSLPGPSNSINSDPVYASISSKSGASFRPVVEVEAKNLLVARPPSPEPDYRTKPDYSVKIQDAVEVIHIPHKDDQQEDSESSSSDDEAEREDEKHEPKQSDDEDPTKRLEESPQRSDSEVEYNRLEQDDENSEVEEKRSEKADESLDLEADEVERL